MSWFGEWNIKTTPENMVQHTREQWSFLQHPSVTLPSEKIKSSPRNRHCRTFVTSSNCICRTKDVYPIKHPWKLTWQWKKQPFGDVSVSPIQNGVRFPGVYIYDKHLRVQPREKVKVKRFGEILRMKTPEIPSSYPPTNTVEISKNVYLVIFSTRFPSHHPHKKQRHRQHLLDELLHDFRFMQI